QGVAALHRACDALLTMSDSEAGPNHVLEAMASGRPVIYRQDGNEASAAKELLGAGCGLPSFLMSTYKQGLADVIQSLQDQKAGEAARQRVLDHYTPERIFPQYLDALRKALDEAKPGLLKRVGRALRMLA